MRRLLRSIFGHSRETVLVIALTLSIAMIVMDDDSRLNIARGSVVTVMNTGRVVFSGVYYFMDVWRENHRLRESNLQYSRRYHSREYVFSENERLREMLGLKNRSVELDSAITANVLGHDFDRMVNSMVLDVGRRDGVRKNMAVITPEGLVGRVYDVYQSSSNVQLILDVNSKISARAGEVHGIIRWEGGSNLRMYGLPWSRIPEVGTKVYSTGLGGVFPGGLLIGEVVSAKTGEVEQHASVIVRPSVNFSRVHEVFILSGQDSYTVWQDEGGHFQRPEIK